MTEFRQENGQVRITKGCKQQTACDVQAQSNRTLCYEYPYVRVCHSCCEGDFCNDDMELPPFRYGKSDTEVNEWIEVSSWVEHPAGVALA